MQKEVNVRCSDGFELGATIFEATDTKGAVMIGPATGIKQTFYYAFASYLAEHGYSTITFDNRGIGRSKGKDINDGNPSLIHWGRLDMTAILEELKEHFPNIPYHLVGHSAGGQLVGLMDNALEFHSIFNFGCSSGSTRHYSFPFTLQGNLFLNIIIPLGNLFLGYTPSQWVGMGEPLPKGVSAQWRKYCNGQGYIEEDLGTVIKEHHYYDMRMPSLWIHATDDHIANMDNVKDMIRVHRQLPHKIISLHPGEHGFESIGHMQFFSKKKKVLWKMALEWFERHQ